MLWSIEYPDAPKIIAAYQFHGEPIPKALIAPELHDIEWHLWRAFWDLSTERQAGMAAGPIPWSAMVKYWQCERWLPMEQFARVIREMDGAYREAGKRQSAK